MNTTSMIGKTCTSLSRRFALVAGAMGIAMLVIAGGAVAQAYPSKPITIVVPYPAGGSTDVIARVLADKLSGLLDGTVIVENRPGAGGTIGASSVARAEPDGYTFLMAPSGVLALAPLMAETKPFDSVKDFTPVAAMHTQPLVLVSRSEGGYKSMDEIRAAHKEGKRLTMGLTGNGSLTHYASYILAEEMGIDFVLVPYAGGAPLIAALMSGEVDIGFLAGSDARVQMNSGALQPLLVTKEQRPAIFSEVPSLEEVGLSDPAIESWNGFYGPAGLPEDIVEKVGSAIRTVYESGAIDKFMNGSEMLDEPTSELIPHLASDIDKFGHFVEASGFNQ